VEGIVIDTRTFFRKTNLSPAEKKKIKEESKQIEKEMYKRMNELIEHGIDDLKDVLGRAPAKGFEYGPKGSVKDLRSLKEKLSIAGMEIKGRRQFEEAEAILRNLFTQIEALENEKEKKINQLTRGEELPTGVLEMVKVYVATKRQPVGRRQGGRPPRKQGRHRADPARGGHAVPRGRDAGGHRAQSAGRAQPHERRPDPGGPPGLGDEEAGDARDLPAVRRAQGEGDRGVPGQGGPLAARQDQALRRPHRRVVRRAGHGGHHVHHEAATTWWTTRSTRARRARTR
jgi:hypothetical protein